MNDFVKPDFRMCSDPPDCDVEKVKEELKAFNDGIVGDDNHEELNLCIHNGEGQLIAGLCGGTYWGWLNIERLWVHENYRSRGLGKLLVETAEKQAIDRGCRHAHVDTMDFQAPGMYTKLGYRVMTEYRNLPAGHSRIFLTKSLSDTSES